MTPKATLRLPLTRKRRKPSNACHASPTRFRRMANGAASSLSVRSGSALSTSGAAKVPLLRSRCPREASASMAEQRASAMVRRLVRWFGCRRSTPVSCVELVVASSKELRVVVGSRASLVVPVTASAMRAGAIGGDGGGVGSASFGEATAA